MCSTYPPFRIRRKAANTQSLSLSGDTTVGVEGCQTLYFMSRRSSGIEGRKMVETKIQVIPKLVPNHYRANTAIQLDDTIIIVGGGGMSGQYHYHKRDVG
jgi:hypothetical protein